MKALTITNEAVTREALLELAEKIPGAWVGIRIAALLLLLEGWKSSAVASLFGLTRWSVVRWIQGVNERGTVALSERNSRDVPVVLMHRFSRLWRTT